MSINTQQVQALPFTELTDDLALIQARFENIIESEQRDLKYYTSKGGDKETVIKKYDNRISAMQHNVIIGQEVINRIGLHEVHRYVETLEKALLELAKTGKANVFIMFDFQDGQMVASYINPY